MAANDLKITTTGDGSVVRFEGALDLYHIKYAKGQLEKLGRKARPDIDLSGVTRLDSAGAMFLKLLEEKGHKLRVEKMPKEFLSLLGMVQEANYEPVPEKPCQPHFVLVMEHLGKATIKAYKDTIEILTFFGRVCVALVAALAQPHKLRYSSITYHVEHIGMNAVPIVGLIAFLISIVLAYQGIAQLKPLGAEQFTVNLVAISVLREMGVLLTAIMVAGRSGSAFTAEIGVMKLREEVDALRTIGLDPMQMLVVPRIIALIIALPLLAFIANMMGLLGGAVLSQSLIDISFSEYFERIANMPKIENSFFVGMIKSPVFAIAIGVIGCMHGMKVSGSSESVGRETTASVVKSIFLVLMLDALFSIFFQQIGI